MRLIHNSRAVALRAHSVKFWLAAVFCLLGGLNLARTTFCRPG